MPRPAPPLPPLTPAQQQMVVDNLGLVGWTMNRYFRTTPAALEADMHQDGVIGLISAVRKFEPERGNRFSTMATPWIRQAIQRGDGDRQGVDFRRWQAGAGPRPDRPLSLDATVDAHAVETELCDFVADPRADVYEAADERLLVAEVLAAFRKHCSDDVDRTLVALVLANPEATDVDVFRQAQERHPLTRQALASRLGRLRAAAARSLGVEPGPKRCVGIDRPHGEPRRYRAGCRCDKCTLAMSAHNRVLRAERKAAA